MDEEKKTEEKVPRTMTPEAKRVKDILALKKRVKDIFRDTLNAPGSMLENSVVAALLRVSYKSVSRWRQESFIWEPKIELYGPIVGFCEDVQAVRKEMMALAKAWDGLFGGMVKATQEALFGPKLTAIFRCGSTTDQEKSEEACLYVLRKYAEMLREQKSEEEE